MTTTLPPHLQQFVEQELASGEFDSESALVIQALDLYREMKSRHAELRAEVQESLASADRGEVAPLDMEDVIAEVERRTSQRRAIE